MFEAGTFLIVGGNGLVSTGIDGTNWTVRATGTTNGLHGAAFGNGTFVVVGEASTILQSDPLMAGAIGPRLSNPTHRDGTFTVSVATTANRRYILEFTNNLSWPAWNALPAVNGDGTTQTLRHINGDATQRFYRVRVESDGRALGRWEPRAVHSQLRD